MAPLEFWKALSAKPFVPFRMFVDDGRGYDVLHPSDAHVDSLQVVVGIDPEAESGVFRKSLRFTPDHITRIELLPELESS